MKRYLILFFFLTILFAGCEKRNEHQSPSGSTEFFRSREFHEKYKLAEVVVFSRHNIRSPLAEPGSFISGVTPYTWHDFGVKASELTAKGGVLEIINGQFFRKWLVSEGLFFESVEPDDDEIYVLSNSKQRTIATARCFLAGFMPTKEIAVNHVGKLNDMDPDFALSIGPDVTEDQWKQIKAEYEAEYDSVGIRKASKALQPNYDLLSDILNLRCSPAYRDGSFEGFNDHNSVINFPEGDEPRMTASINDACTVADALILQYYEEPDLQKVAFGKNLTVEQWQMLSRIIEKRDEIRFHSTFVQRYVSQRQRKLIADALQTEGRKFTYFCGHDTNLLNILKAMRVLEYDIPDAIEVSTPIGSKIVFEKWIDESGNAFVGVSHIYQTICQLRENTFLDLSTTPDCIHLQFEGMQANAEGLYPLDMMIQRLQETACIE